MMNSTRLKEIMTVQSKAGVGRLELNFETAFEVIEALEQVEQALEATERQVVARSGETAAERVWRVRAEQAEQAVQRVQEVCDSEAYEVSNEYGTYNAVAVDNILEALDGDGRG